MKEKLSRPGADEDARIARGIAADPDAALGRSRLKASSGAWAAPPKPDRKVSVSLRLDREVVERFKATGSGTRINAALRKFGAR